MKNALRFSHVMMIVALLSFTLSVAAYATGDVTFTVNMKIQIKKGLFVPASDSVYVTGDFLGWGIHAFQLTQMSAPNDSMYQGTVLTVAEGGINYKYTKTLRGGVDWENGGNRPFTVVAGAQSAGNDWFSNDSVYNPEATVNFQCNMRVQILKGNFLPGSGDIVRLAGSMNGWGGSTDTMHDTHGDSVYWVTLSANPNVTDGSAQTYKFLKTLRGGKDWEDGSNHVYNVPAHGGGTTPPHYFNDDSLYFPPLPATNVLFQVDMNVYESLNWFRPDLGDSVELRGGINGWGGGTIMQENLFTPGVYEVNLPYTGNVHDLLPYKMRMKLDSTRAAANFPGYGGDQNNVAYEHPVETGDGNRLFDVGYGGNVYTGPLQFSSIDSCGVIPAGDTVTFTARIDMRPAIGQLGFNPSTDSVTFTWYDALSRRNQAKLQGSFANVVKMTKGLTDSIFSCDVTMIGPAHYNIQYFYTPYVGPSPLAEGGGFGNFRYRSRTIVPLGAHLWPRHYSLNLDTWIGVGKELPSETPSCGAYNHYYSVADGWNLVSLPLSLNDYTAANIYPSAVSKAFAYSSGYVPTTIMSNGPGYWLKFSGGQTIPIFGARFTTKDIPVTTGWNMIGSVSGSVAVGSITTTPGGIVNSNYFSYSGGYNVATSIDPGLGYWVRVSAPGTIHLVSTDAAKQSVAVDPSAKFNKLTITDRSGHEQVLYFGANGSIDQSRYAMPPVPPQGAFDARFFGNQSIAVVDPGQVNSFPVQISSANGSVKISWKLVSSTVTGTLVIGSKEIALNKNGSTTVSGNVKLVLNGTPNGALLPKEYALSQNYPNPFNPTTTLQYQLPSDSRVTVKIYDILGNEVKTLVDETQDAGYKSAVWNSTNNNGLTVSSGIYFVRISATNIANPAKAFVDTKKMMLLK